MPDVIDEQTLRAALGKAEGTADLLEGWAASQATLPRDPLFFLEPAFVAAAAQEAALDSQLSAAMAPAALRIEGDQVARALAWHIFRRLFRTGSFEGVAADRWPIPRALLGEHAGLLYLLALFGGLPELRAFHGVHAVPGWVARDTLHDAQRWADHYRRHYGGWGIEPAYLRWLRLHLCGDLYELGRLQYQPGSWTLPVRAFRHRTTGAVVALSDEGVRFRADGQRAGDADDPEGAWTARLELGSVCIVGHRIAPDGRAEGGLTRVATAEWSQVLSRGDPVLHLHIFRGAALDLDACRRSLEEALRFFPVHFPERPIAAFACESWLLDGQLADLLPARSNLARFQRQFYLLPVAGDDRETLDWVFDGVPRDLSQAPRDTTLRRAVLDHLAGGGHFHAGGCFLLPEDLPAWGTGVYLHA